MLILGLCSISFATDLDGTDIGGINFCQKVDRYNVSTYKGMQFVKVTGSGYLFPYSGAYYAVRVVYVGYKSMISQRGFYNSTEIGTDTGYFSCPKSYSNVASGNFRAGRVVDWLIPASLNPGGGNTVTVTMDGHTISTSGL